MEDIAGILLTALIVGLALAWFAGVKPELEKRINNTDTIEKHYKEKR